MNANQILHAGILDLIFEGRNKLYGAYQIRKNYQKRLCISLLLIIFLSILLIFILNRYTPAFKNLNVIVFDEPGYAAPPKPDLPQNKLQKQALNSDKRGKTEASKLEKIVKTGNRIEFSNISIKYPVDAPEITKSGVDWSNNNIPGALDGSNSEVNNGNVSAIEIPDSTTLNAIENPDIMPSFPGGEVALMKFLKKNLQMPEMNQSEGSVKIIARFIINMDGKMTSLTTNGEGDEFDREVKRVLQKMPPWMPGKSKGRTISCYFKIPIIFNIGGY